MLTITRRFGLALVIASTVFTIVTASAASLNMTAPSAVGADQQAVTAPCDSVDVAYTHAYDATANAFYLSTVTLTGTTCTGTDLTVDIRLKTGAATSQDYQSTHVTAAALEAGLDVDVSTPEIQDSDFAGIAVLITG